MICVSSVDDYAEFLELISANNGTISEEDRKRFAGKAFNVSSHYDTAIFNYFNKNHDEVVLKISETNGKVLRYGENPHQKGFFFGDFDELFTKLHGKELSYNNLLDVDAAVNLMLEFTNDAPTFAILKHNNACGLAQRDTLHQAYVDALAGDPVSAFGGVLISNKEIVTSSGEKKIIENLNKKSAENLLKNPNNFREQTMQKMASDILGLEFKEVKQEVLELPDIQMETFQSSSSQIKKFAWVKKIGCALVNFIEVEIGGTIVDRHYGDWINIWNELTGSQKNLDPTVPNQVQNSKMTNLNPINYTNSLNGFI